MMSLRMSVVSLICVILLCIILSNKNGATAILCYECNSGQQPDKCGDSFRREGVTQVNCSIGQTTCIKTREISSGSTVITRGCNSGYYTGDVYYQLTYAGKTTYGYACVIDNCNPAPSIHTYGFTKPFLVAIIIIAFKLGSRK